MLCFPAPNDAGELRGGAQVKSRIFTDPEGQTGSGLFHERDVEV